MTDAASICSLGERPGLPLDGAAHHVLVTAPHCPRLPPSVIGGISAMGREHKVRSQTRAAPPHSQVRRRTGGADWHSCPHAPSVHADARELGILTEHNGGRLPDLPSAATVGQGAPSVTTRSNRGLRYSARVCRAKPNVVDPTGAEAENTPEAGSGNEPKFDAPGLLPTSVVCCARQSTWRGA